MDARFLVRTRESGLLVGAAVIGLASWLHGRRRRTRATQKAHEVLLAAFPSGAPLSLTPSARSPGALSPRPRSAASRPGRFSRLGVNDRFRGRPRRRGRGECAARRPACPPGGSLRSLSRRPLISNGFSASVGLEAAHTPVCGGAFGSLLGRALGARRSDMRLLVGCGAAGAIAGAFDAPLAGAFYAFEAILGAYSLSFATPGRRRAQSWPSAISTGQLLHRPGLSAPCAAAARRSVRVGVHVICAFRRSPRRRASR